MAEIGATPKGGVRRLTLTDVDRRGRDRFRAECEAAGLTVRVDAIGNMFARRAGRDPNRLPVLFGSHLDSQPSRREIRRRARRAGRARGRCTR